MKDTNENPSIAEIKPPKYRNIADTLRKIADEVEADNGDETLTVVSAVIVLQRYGPDPIAVHGAGKGELEAAYTLLGLGQRFLERQI